MTQHRSEELSREIFNLAGVYSKSQLNDLKLDDGWLRSVRLDGKTWLTRSYAVWQGIKSRSNPGGSFQNTFKHYEGTTVCPVWANSFDAFADWYTKQVGYKEGWDVDKDVLSGSKHYSPDTCLLLPRVVNLLFGKKQAPLNTVYTQLSDGTSQWRTKDGRVFNDLSEARVWSRGLRLDRLNTLRESYPEVPEIVFQKAALVVPKA